MLLSVTLPCECTGDTKLNIAPYGQLALLFKTEGSERGRESTFTISILRELNADGRVWWSRLGCTSFDFSAVCLSQVKEALTNVASDRIKHS